jgi:hypothetical protein
VRRRIFILIVAALNLLVVMIVGELCNFAGK